MRGICTPLQDGGSSQASGHRARTVPIRPDRSIEKPTEATAGQVKPRKQPRGEAGSKEGRFTPYAPSVLTLGKAPRLIVLFRNELLRPRSGYTSQSKR
jgi:hypothetical protein